MEQYIHKASACLYFANICNNNDNNNSNTILPYLKYETEQCEESHTKVTCKLYKSVI